MNLVNSVSSFMKRNASTIFSGFAVVGVIATGIFSGKGTYEAMNALEQKKEQELTKKEKIKQSIPFYIPAVTIGVSTIACIAGANILNRKQQAALTSAYMLLSNSYKEYRNKVKELHGEDADWEIREGIAYDNFPEGTVPENKIRFYDEFSKRWFVSTMEDVAFACYHYNRNFALRGTAHINEFYEFLGIPKVSYGYDLGFSSCEMIEGGLTPWIDIYTRDAITCDGEKYTILYFGWEPIPNFEEYETF